MTIAKAKAPKQVGRYQLAYEVATSYLGPLWVARIEGSDPGLAMLRLVSLSRLDADTRVRLLEAAWQAMEVRDPRVASATDVVASDGELSVISEYVEGTPLRGFNGLVSVRRKPVPVPVALRFILDLVDGALALHRAMAELGDEAVPLFGGFSADSVLIGANGRATILDVAIASAASTVESLGTSPERVAYAAPEQIGGEGVDARTDVFSLGVLAWELLSNRRLFAGAEKGVAQRVLTAKIARLDEGPRKGEAEIGKPLADVVMRALERDPSARFESVEALRTALEAAKLSPAGPEEAAQYVVSIADGAFARAREALSLPPRPRSEATVAGAMRLRAALHTPSGQRPAVTQPNPDASTPRAIPVRPAAVRVSLNTSETAARPTTPAAASPAAVASAKPSVNPSTHLGWRALEPPANPPRSVPPNQQRLATPSKVRPRQATMIGLPPPADSRVVRPDAPPAQPAVTVVATVPVTAGPTPITPPIAVPLTEPPPSSDGSEEPTAQYSREHLRQLADSPAPLSEVPPPVELRVPPKTEPAQPVKRESQAPLSRLAPHQPTPRPLSEIHTERPPPPEAEPEPVAPFRVAAPLPPADLGVPAPQVAAAPLPARLDPPGPVGAAGSSLSPPRGDHAPSRNGDFAALPVARQQERPPFSKPPPATAQPSYLPSQIAPPLVHDPRANRRPSLRPSGLHFTRGVVLGVVVSFALVVVSTVVALFLMRRSAPEATDDARANAAVTTPAPTVHVENTAAAVHAEETAPAPTLSGAAASASAPEVTPAPTALATAEAPAPAVAAAASNTEPAPSEPASTTAEPATAARAPSHAAPRAARPTKKTKKRFVPSDI